jgi:hypothetical protein
MKYERCYEVGPVNCYEVQSGRPLDSADKDVSLYLVNCARLTGSTHGTQRADGGVARGRNRRSKPARNGPETSISASHSASAGVARKSASAGRPELMSILCSCFDHERSLQRLAVATHFISISNVACPAAIESPKQTRIASATRTSSPSVLVLPRQVQTHD